MRDTRTKPVDCKEKLKDANEMWEVSLDIISLLGSENWPLWAERDNLKSGLDENESIFSNKKRKKVDTLSPIEAQYAEEVYLVCSNFLKLWAEETMELEHFATTPYSSEVRRDGFVEN